MNQEEMQIQTESRIQDLLAGASGPQETAELLSLVARDDAARKLLGEMVDLQRQARRSVGLDVSEQLIQASLASALGAIQSGQAQAAARRRKGGRRLWRSLAWPLRAAAVIAVAAAVGLTVIIHNDVRNLRSQIQSAGVKPSVVVADLGVKDLAALRTLWQEVSDESGDTRPWILLSDGKGEFGYLPVPPGRGANGNGPTLVRCIIVADDQRQTAVNMLLSTSQPTPLMVPKAGRVGDQPMDITVSAGGGYADVDLKVGDVPDNQVGVRGRVSIHGRAVEVGQFRLGGQKMTVFLQALKVGKELT